MKISRDKLSLKTSPYRMFTGAGKMSSRNECLDNGKKWTQVFLPATDPVTYLNRSHINIGHTLLAVLDLTSQEEYMRKKLKARVFFRSLVALKLSL